MPDLQSELVPFPSRRTFHRFLSRKIQLVYHRQADVVPMEIEIACGSLLHKIQVTQDDRKRGSWFVPDADEDPILIECIQDHLRASSR